MTDKGYVVIPMISISWHGGVRVLIQLANYLAAAGYKVEFLVSRGRCSAPFKISEKVIIRQVGIHTGMKTLDYMVFLLFVLFAVNKRAVLIANFFVTYYPVRLLSLTRGMAYLYFVQDIESKYESMQGRLLNLLCNMTYKDSNIICANSYLRDCLKKRFNNECRFISIGPDLSFYGLPRQSAKKFDLIYFLRAEPWKGIDRFLRFMSLAQDRFSCLCVSQDERAAKLLANTEAIFRKPSNDIELVECFDSARIVFSTSYREGFALPPLEGMARGLPSVLFPCGGPEAFIRDGLNACYVHSEAEAFEVINHLLMSSEKYEAMSREARRTANQFRMDKSLAAMTEFISQCA